MCGCVSPPSSETLNPMRTFRSLQKTRPRRSPRTSGSVCARGFFRSTSSNLQ
nr:MAG TPA: hypothetical protein [Caudoviricetes sp.]